MAEPASRAIPTSALVVVFFVLLAGDAVRYSMGWIGFGAIAALLVASAIVVLVLSRRSWSVASLPIPLLAFIGLITLSIAWSAYPGWSALGVASTIATAAAGLAVAIAANTDQIVRALGLALRIIIGLSLAFELVVATIVRGPVLPLVAAPGVDYATLDTVPPLLYWSRNELFEVFDGGRIQGIVGNASLLAFVALLGVIVFALQLADRSVSRANGIVSLAAAGACLLFTRSATITVSLVVIALVAIIALLVRRAQSTRGRAIVMGTAAGIVAIGAVGAVVARGPLLALLGKSEDLTGRLGIWSAVIGLASERPVLGWGWVSYWVPWTAPFDTLVFRNGVRQLHAHNAWLDLWLQVGILGVLVFAALVLSTLVRSWWIATDAPRTSPTTTAPYTATTLLPLLLMIALIMQSLAESRLLVEYGFFLLVLLAVLSIRAPRVSTPPLRGRDPRAAERAPR